MNIHRKLLPFVFAALLITPATVQAQAVSFTGFVDQDFAGLTTVLDPGGLDVNVPLSMGQAVSGWDLHALALSFDETTDTLYVGLDTYGILGDADGDADASRTSPALTALGGTDQVDLGGTETFVVVFDLNDDGTPDVIAGIPLGGQLSDFKVARYNTLFSLSNARMAFGNTLPTNTGTYLGTPIPQCPDVEFTIPNFCDLLNQFAAPGQSGLGVYVYLGSQDDAIIGEDRLHGNTTDDVLRVPFTDFVGCLPIRNNYAVEVLAPAPTQGQGWTFTTSYGVPAGFGCCLLVSSTPHSGLYLPAPIDVTILVGTGPQDTLAVDLGYPPQTSACMCKENTYLLPPGVESLTFYSQIFAYRPNFDPNESVNFLASNRLAIGPADYPSVN